MIWKRNISSFNVSEYISCIIINNENTSSGKLLTLVKTTLLPGHNGVSVVASLPTSQSRDVTANIPIQMYFIFEYLVLRELGKYWMYIICKETKKKKLEDFNTDLNFLYPVFLLACHASYTKERQSKYRQMNSESQ